MPDNDPKPTEEKHEEPTKAEVTPTEEKAPEAVQEDVNAEKDAESTEGSKKNGKIKQKFAKFSAWYKSHKKISIPLTVLAVIGLLMLIPFTRYAVLGTFMQQTVTVSVQDSQTNRPVTEAQVSIAGKTADTDNNGQAQLKVKVGPKTATVTKANYKDAKVKVTVPVLKQKKPAEVKLEATGRPVLTKVTNKISRKPAENVLVKSGDAEARTDKEGTATIVVPAGQEKVTLELSGDGYVTSQAEVEVEKAIQEEANLQVTPAGKVYFLSKKSGKIDVVKTNLDGSERQVVLAGTGKEDSPETVMLASRDWKYLALQSKRDGGESAKLFLIETGSDKVTVMDEGNATFSLNGWTDHNFVYTVNRKNVKSWEHKREALKGYNAETKKISILDETEAAGDGDYNSANESLSNVYVLPGNVVYTKTWNQNYNAYDPVNRKVRIMSVSPTGQNKKALKEFPTYPAEGAVSYLTAKSYAPDEIYYAVNGYGSAETQYFEYEDGKVITAKDANADTFSKFYPTYLLSPSGKQNTWYESRDGKNVIFVGDDHGKNERQAAILGDFVSYGWYSDNYILVSKNSSELYIMPSSGSDGEAGLTKVTDYHKPAYDFSGYGGGYGGF